MVNSLSGRFLILTIIFVMVAEVLIFVPSVARFREDYLLARLERAQIASLALLADDMIEPELEKELLDNAGVFNVVLRRDEIPDIAGFTVENEDPEGLGIDNLRFEFRELLGTLPAPPGRSDAG